MVDTPTYSTVPPPKEQETYPIQTNTDPLLDGEALDQRAFQYHVALGDNSPGFDEIKSKVASGNEEPLQGQLVDQEMATRAATGKSLMTSAIQEGVTEDPQLVAALADPGAPPNKSTILEEQYTKKVFDYLVAADDSSAVMKVLQDNPMGIDKKYQALEEIVQKRLIAKAAKARMDKVIKDEGWIDYGSNVLLQLAWFPSYFNIVGNAEGGAQSSSYNTGDAMGEKVQYIYDLPPAEMDDAIRKEVEALSVTNPLDAQQFVNALISYSAGDADANMLNDLGIAPVAAAVKIARSGAKEFRAAGEIAEATRAAGKAAGAKGAQAATGVAEGAGKAATEAPKATQTGWEVGGKKFSSARELNAAFEATFKGQSKRQRLLADQAALDAYAAEKGISPEEMRKTLQENYDSNKAYGEALGNIVKSEEFKAAQKAEKNSASGIKFKTTESKEIDPETGLLTDGPLKPPAEAQLESVARAAASHTDIPTALSGTGNAKKAALATIRAEEATRALGDVAPAGARRDFSNLVKRMGSMFNTKVKANDGDNFYGNIVSNLEDLVRKQVDDYKKTAGLLHGSRIPEEAMGKAIDNAAVELQEQYKSLNDYVLDVEKALPGDSPLGVGTVKISWGNKNREGFATVEEAVQARRAYGLNPAEATIANYGGKYKIEAWTTAREDNVLDDILTPENQMKNRNMSRLRGWLGSRMQTSEFQSKLRNTVVQSEAKFKTLMTELYQPYFDLSKREKLALDEVLKMNQLEERIPGNPNTRGMYYTEVADLERAYMRTAKRPPTKSEVKAYFSMMHASNMHWAHLSMNTWKLKATQGFKQITTSRAVEGGAIAKTTFEGRIVDPKNFPKNSGHNIDVLLVNEKGWIDKVNLSKLDDETRGKLDEALLNGKIIQPWNDKDAKVLQHASSEDPVSFIITPDVHQTPLNMSRQVNYRPGWHNIYKSKYFLKQAVAKDGRYFGDTTIMGFDTEAQLKKYGSKMEEARKLLVAGDFEKLDKLLNEHLPFNRTEFEKLFDERLDRNVPLSFVPHGEKAMNSLLADGRNFADHDTFKNLDTTRDRLYSPGAGLVDPFVAKRDPVLWTAKNAGTEDNPLHVLENADLLSPMLSQTKAMGRVIKSEFYNDYQLSSAHQWVESFAGSIYYNGVQVSKEDLRRNPIFFLGHADIKAANPSLQRQAEQTKLAIVQLIGTPSKWAEDVDHFMLKTVAPIFGKDGEKYLEYIPTTALNMVKNPVTYLRSAAFHVKLGLFNPVQFFVQGMAVTNVVAISPSAGLQSFHASLGMRFLRHRLDAATINSMAEKVAAMPGSKWTKEMFTDSLNMMRKVGLDDIGSNAWRDGAGDPNLYESAKFGKKFLDKGQVFFQEGERVVRSTAWNTAYLEYAQKFPKKIGKFNEYDIANIKDRAMKLAGNMTRDSNAFWQNDARFSLFTQFQAYNVRMAELMVGKQLSRAEAARLFLAQCFLWGMPPAAGALYAIENQDPQAAKNIINPWGEDLQSYADRNGKNLDGTAVDALYRGMFSKAMEFITGEQLDFGGRYGMSAPRMFETLRRNMEEKGDLPGILVTAFGPSGSVVNDIFNGVSDVAADLRELASGERTKGELLPADLQALTKSFSGINAWSNMAAIVNSGARRNKNGIITDSYDDPLMDLAKTLLGVEDVNIPDTFNALAADKNRQKAVQKLKKEAGRYSAKIAEARAKGDNEEADRYKDILFALLDGTDLSPDEKLQLLFPSDKYYNEQSKYLFQNMMNKASGTERINLEEAYRRRFGNN